jgi:DNA-binding protein H-NS
MTKKVDLDGLDYNELQALIAEANEKSHAKRLESLTEAVASATAELEKCGFTLADLIAFVGTTGEGGKGKGTRKAREDAGRKVAPKYRDPANPENTWAGRGRMPRWISDKIGAGAKLEDFAIS